MSAVDRNRKGASYCMRGTEVMSPEKQDNLDEVRFDSAFKARVVKIKPGGCFCNVSGITADSG